MNSNSTAKKVLLVDDAEVFLEIEKILFKRTGANILTAKTGQDAIDIALKEKPDIVLLDLKLPDCSGIEVCRELKKNPFTCHIPIVIVTAFGSPEDMERCREAGCDDFVFKPIDHAELIHKVARILKIPYRHSMRVLVRLELESQGKSEAFLCTSSNISVSGILIETEKILEKGSRQKIKFFLPGNIEIRAEAEVVREERAGRSFRYGLRFVELLPEAEKALRTFIEARE